MRLTDLEVRHFRNIGHARLELAAGVNVLWGANAQGKTNMLEAAYYLVTGRSFRTRIDKDCLPWDEAAAPAQEPTAVIRGRLRRESGAHELLVTITARQKRVSGDAKPIARLAMLWGRLNAVLFTPADLGIVQGAPGERRQFLDTTLSQLSPPYLYHLQRYAHALKQRNALLRSNRPAAALAAHFDAWEQQLTLSGIEIGRARLEHIGRLGEATARHYRAIARADAAGDTPAVEDADTVSDAGATSSGDGERLAMRYVCFLKSVEALEDASAAERFAERLRASREDDARRGATSAGPHRDDFVFSLGGHDLREFGSQGQQRSAILALRLAEVDVMTERAGEPPVLLLDDIIGELDPARTSAFLRRLAATPVQTLLTATSCADIARQIAIERVWRVEAGQFAAREERSESRGS